MEEDKGETRARRPHPDGEQKEEFRKEPRRQKQQRKPDSSMSKPTKNQEEKTKEPTEATDSVQRATPSLRKLRSERGSVKGKNPQGTRRRRTARQEEMDTRKKISKQGRELHERTRAKEEQGHKITRKGNQNGNQDYQSRKDTKERDRGDGRGNRREHGRKDVPHQKGNLRREREKLKRKAGVTPKGETLQGNRR